MSNQQYSLRKTEHHLCFANVNFNISRTSAFAKVSRLFSSQISSSVLSECCCHVSCETTNVLRLAVPEDLSEGPTLNPKFPFPLFV